MSKLPKIADNLKHLEHVNIAQLAPLQEDGDHALKELSKKRYNKLKKSIEKHGFIIPLFVWNGRIIDGHQRRHLLLNEGWLIDVPIVRIEAETEKQAREILLIVTSQYGEITLGGLEWFTHDFDDDWVLDHAHFDALPFVFEDWDDDPPIKKGDKDRGSAPPEDLPLPNGVPDTIWPTDNEWGIPLLNIERQADAFDLPIETWGAKKRGTNAGTIHFYTDDSRFSALWSNPLKVADANPINIVEPNYSVYDQVPRAVALWATYKKRWLARYWQSLGIRVFVDLNVARPYDDINLLGVPSGWRSYATRGYSERLHMTDEELAIAKAHAGTNDVLFMVYGGGKKVKQWCADNSAVWVAEDMDRAKGRYLDALGSALKGDEEE